MFPFAATWTFSPIFKECSSSQSVPVDKCGWPWETPARWFRIQLLLRLTFRDSVPESYQGRPQLLETFKPSYALSKVKSENDAMRNRITEFWQATHFSTKNPINKPAMNNRRLLIAAVFHFVHPEEKDSKKQQVDTKHCQLQLSK